MKTITANINRLIRRYHSLPKEKGWGWAFSLAFLPLALSAQTTVSTMQGSYTNGEYVNTSSITIAPNTIIAPGNGQSVYIHLTAVNCLPLATAPSANQNYIMTSIPRIPGYVPGAAGYANCDVMQTVQYIDGLGRPLQTVQVRGTGDGTKDLVQPFYYDQFGRENFKYLPYAPGTAADGSYKPGALLGDQQNYYSSPPAGVASIPFALAATVFEPSPLNRMAEQGAPGSDWTPTVYNGSLGAGHTMKMSYGTNIDGEVILWTVNGNGNGATGNTSYGAGQLYKTITTDENQNQTIEYKDKEDHIVCKKVQSDNTGNNFYTTSYVYNDLGQLSYVIPQIPAGIPSSFTEADVNFTGYIYGYHYDARGRLAEKKIPGKGWEYMVYNGLDQVVATQDAVQAQSNWYTFTKYDGMGRVIQAGRITDARNHQAITDAIANQTQSWETPDGSTNGYTATNSFPNSWDMLYTVNYYDNYSYAGAGTYAPTTTTSSATTGLLTGTRTNILGTTTMLLTEMYYDDKGRLQESIAQNHIGGYDRTVNSYNFSNEVTNTIRTHTSGTVGSLAIANTYTYDHMGRKVQTTEQINGGQQVTISQATFNDVGQLLNKSLGNNLQNIAYSYNERGWLKTASAPLFAMQLNYNDGTTPQWNGNIANQYWGTPGSLNKNYTYSYDNLNRLTAGNSNTGNSENNITYDPLGNLSSLNRSGVSAATLTYGYSGNQLTNMNNNGQQFRFYEYDANGNAGSDGFNNTISYNYLNLPAAIHGRSLTYTYDATGNKLRKTSGNTVTDYLGEIQYTNGSIDFIRTEEGRAINNGGNYIYEYTLNDHLGNSRVSFDQNAATTVKQQDDYYPFGLLIETATTSPPNKYLYNKKELQSEFGQYDYGARFYDPVIARWTTTDPLGEFARRQSPYNYALNNPVRFIDPTGMATDDPTYIDPKTTNLKEVVITATPIHKSTSAAIGSFLWGAVDYIPFAGSIKQIGVGIYHGSWKEAGLGVGMFAIDVFTGGEGGEAIRVSEVLAEDALKVAAEDEIKEGAEKSLEDIGKQFEEHHSDPEFMEGDPNQNTTTMEKGEHKELHKDLNKHLDNYKNGKGDKFKNGNLKTMKPSRGNSGQRIQTNFSRQERLKAMGDFYKQTEAKYGDAAKDFFSQHPHLK